MAGKPKLDVRYRSGYIASAKVTAPATPELTAPAAQPEDSGEVQPEAVGIDSKVEPAGKNELRVYLALAAGTVTRTPDGKVVLDATFTETDAAGKVLGAGRRRSGDFSS